MESETTIEVNKKVDLSNGYLIIDDEVITLPLYKLYKCKRQIKIKEENYGTSQRQAI